MIPKIIHYCWFGRGPKSKLVERCISSWKKVCPDYQIVEWNEDNFDVEQTIYLKWCYEHKKWAFLSDLARLLIVYNQGGIYLDTDVELIKRPDDLLENGAFFCFENNKYIATGLGFGACKHHTIIKKMIEEYKNINMDVDGNMQMIGCPTLNTKALLPMGLELNGNIQQLDDVLILSEEYMNPYDDPTGRLNITSNTISIHWYAKSALSKKQILRSKITQPFHRCFGTDCFRWLKR